MASDGTRRTAGLLGRWAQALPADWYDVRLVLNEAKSVAMSRQYRPDQLPAAAGWMRHMNSQGWHVYCRPGCTSHVLIDDLDANGLASLTVEHQVAAVVETSRRNFQAWVTISSTSADPGIATRFARALAARHGGDPGAADAFHLGRLPGLCNRKAEHATAGGYPWVLLRHAAAGVCPAAGGLLRVMAEVERTRSNIVATASDTDMPAATRLRLPQQEHEAGATAVRASLAQGQAEDRSRTDYAIALRLLGRGVPDDKVGDVVAAGAKASSLSSALADGYVQRTVRAARRTLSRASHGRDTLG